MFRREPDTTIKQTTVKKVKQSHENLPAVPPRSNTIHFSHFIKGLYIL